MAEVKREIRAQEERGIRGETEKI